METNEPIDGISVDLSSKISPYGLTLSDDVRVSKRGLHVRAAHSSYPGEKLVVLVPWSTISNMVTDELKRMLQSRADKGSNLIESTWIPEREF